MSDDVRNATAAFIATWEGFSPTPYQDVAGVWTIGYGSTRDLSGLRVDANTVAVTEAEGRVLVARELGSAFDDLFAAHLGPLTPGQQTAFADFIYNCGAGAFNGSTMLRLWKSGDRQGAIAQLEQWDHAAGRVVQGLLNRRLAEAGLLGWIA